MWEKLKNACSRLGRAIATPVDYHPRFEVLPMRIFFALVCAFAIPNWAKSGGFNYDGQPYPVGLAHFLDLTFLNDSGTWSALLWIFWLALALFAFGIAPALSTSIAAFIFNAAGAFEGSQGANKHSLQLVGILLLVLAVYYIIQAIRRPREALLPGPALQNLAIFQAQQAIAATYVVTAIYKLAYSKLSWIKDAKHFPVQLVKTRDMDYYNSLQEPDPSNWIDRLSPFIEKFFFEYPNWCRLFIGSGLFLELFAFLALAGRQWGLFYGLGIIAFHLTISRVMNLTFEENMLIIAIFFVNVPGWIYAMAKGRITSPRAAA